MKAPVNDLERAYVAMRGPENYPDLFRKLREATLVFLMPYHPEMMGAKMQLGNGDRLPQFVIWKCGSDGVRIPVFTSLDRANEGCKKAGARDGQYCLAEMKGEQLFQMLACQTYPIILNPACEWGALNFDLNAVKKLADGSIFNAISSNDQKSGVVQPVDPADYPTSFLQPLFQFLRGRPEVKAAWIFREVAPQDPKRVSYVFILLAKGDAEQAKKDFAIVAEGACPPNTDFGVTLLDPKNAALVKITSQHPAFYSAPDFKGPSPIG